MLMLPSWNPSLRPCRALRFERTFLTGCGPVAPYPLAIFLVRKAIRQLLPSRTAIGLFLRQIDKVLLAETAICLGSVRLWLVYNYCDDVLLVREDLYVVDIAV